MILVMLLSEVNWKKSMPSWQSCEAFLGGTKMADMHEGIVWYLLKSYKFVNNTMSQTFHTWCTYIYLHILFERDASTILLLNWFSPLSINSDPVSSRLVQTLVEPEGYFRGANWVLLLFLGINKFYVRSLLPSGGPWKHSSYKLHFDLLQILNVMNKMKEMFSICVYFINRLRKNHQEARSWYLFLWIVQQSKALIWRAIVVGELLRRIELPHEFIW